jgi:hypothetical protein
MFGGWARFTLYECPEAHIFRQIRDDNYLHALRVFLDKDSDAVRLQASIMQGEMKRYHRSLSASPASPLTDHVSRTPVWTAFVTESIASSIASSTWLRKIGPEIVCLTELHPHIFSSNYTPPRTNRGEFLLHFTSFDGKDLVLKYPAVRAYVTTDAEAFVSTIFDLAPRYR